MSHKINLNQDLLAERKPGPPAPSPVVKIQDLMPDRLAGVEVAMECRDVEITLAGHGLDRVKVDGVDLYITSVRFEAECGKRPTVWLGFTAHRVTVRDQRRPSEGYGYVDRVVFEDDRLQAHADGIPEIVIHKPRRKDGEE